MTSLVLASTSPQRRAILEQLGIAFEVAEPGVEEVAEGEPATVVVENALRKARAVGGVAAGRPVLGVDTTVADTGRLYGKPRDESEARRTLEALAGGEHHVWSGLALIAGAAEPLTVAEETLVRFRSLEPPEVEWYLASGEWRGRAGGYAIQGRGAALVERIDGDYWNVVGLPVAALARLAPQLFRI